MKILLADNTELYRDILTESLAGTDIELHFAASGKQALEKAAEHAFDFYALALHLPDTDGVALSQRLRERDANSHVPIVLLTSNTSEGIHRLAQTSGITEVFLKQDIEEFVNFTRRFLGIHSKLYGHVLYVEDSVDQRLYTAALLRQWGLLVDAFANADEAWQAYLEHDYDIVISDIVISDIVLGGRMSGSQLINRIRRLADTRGDVPTLAITAFDDNARRVELYHLGISDYVTKPVIPEELYARLQNLLAHKQVNDRNRMLLETSGLGVIAINEHGLIETFNAEAENIFGYQTDEVLGRNIAMLMPEPHRSQHDDYLQHYLHTGSRCMLKRPDQDRMARHKDGRVFPIQVSLSEMNVSGRRLFSGLIRDVSAQKRLEEEMRRGREAAESASLAKSLFLSSMSHELRTPHERHPGLCPIAGHGPPARCGTARLCGRDQPGQRTPDRSDQRHPGPGPHRGGQAHPERHRRPAREHPRWGTRPDPVHCRGQRHPSHLRRQSGLTSPCRSNPPEAGHAQSALQRREVQPARRLRLGQMRAEWAGTAANQYHRHRSRHPPERLQDLFQPFNRLGQESGPVEGTGIGLVISKHLLEKMDGAIGVESEFGQGSTFWIELPLSHHQGAPAAAAKATDADQADKLSRPARLLYVEDNPINFKLMDHLLHKHTRWTIDHAHDAPMGLKLAEENRYDLILLDIQLPGMDGFEAIGHLKRMDGRGDVPVIAVTASAMREDVERAMAAGFAHYIAKPFQIHELLNTLSSELVKKP